MAIFAWGVVIVLAAVALWLEVCVFRKIEKASRLAIAAHVKRLDEIYAAARQDDADATRMGIPRDAPLTQADRAYLAWRRERKADR